MEMICPRCAKSSNDISFVNDLCIHCHLDAKRQHLPTSVQIVICPMTSKIRVSANAPAKQEAQRYNVSKKKVGEVWVKPNNSLIKQIVKRPFKKAGFDCKYTINDEFITLYFESENGEKVAHKHPFKIEYVKMLSPMASRATGGYFEAIVQLRGDRQKVENYRKKIIKALERHTFITKNLDLPEGVDIYVGQKEKIPAILRDFGLVSQRSKKLSGQRRDTKRLYRDTFLVRL